MPSNVLPSAPVDVFPGFLANQFTVEMRFESLANAYPDGSADRAALVLNPRRLFKLSFPATYPRWKTLRAFYWAHIGVPFYFYVPRETIPPFTVDPTGQAPDGRYIVVFDSAWSDEIRIGRANAACNLREVA